MTDNARMLQVGLRACVRLLGGRAELAAASGVPLRTLDNYLQGRNEPKALQLLALAGAAGRTADWILAGGDGTGEGARPGTIMVPRYDARLSAGSGALSPYGERLTPIPFAEDFFPRRLGRPAANMIMLEVAGDSMAPAIEDGDLVMIDTSDTDLRDQLGAVRVGDELFVKRVSPMGGGEVELLSDNSSFPPRRYRRGEGPSEATVLGRVVWQGRVHAGPKR